MTVVLESTIFFQLTLTKSSLWWLKKMIFGRIAKRLARKAALV